MFQRTKNTLSYYTTSHSIPNSQYLGKPFGLTSLNDCSIVSLSFDLRSPRRVFEIYEERLSSIDKDVLVLLKCYLKGFQDSTLFKKDMLNILEETVKRYAGHPNIVAWQIEDVIHDKDTVSYIEALANLRSYNDKYCPDKKIVGSICDDDAKIRDLGIEQYLDIWGIRCSSHPSLEKMEFLQTLSKIWIIRSQLSWRDMNYLLCHLKSIEKIFINDCYVNGIKKC